MPDLMCILGNFTAPVEIGTTPGSMLYMFPLIAAISLIYKATKMRVLFVKRFFVEALLLFLTVSGFMIAAIIVLNLITWLVTS